MSLFMSPESKMINGKMCSAQGFSQYWCVRLKNAVLVSTTKNDVRMMKCARLKNFLRIDVCGLRTLCTAWKCQLVDGARDPCARLIHFVGSPLRLFGCEFLIECDMCVVNWPSLGIYFSQNYRTVSAQNLADGKRNFIDRQLRSFLGFSQLFCNSIKRQKLLVTEDLVLYLVSYFCHLACR